MPSLPVSRNKKGGVIPRDQLYRKLASHADEAIAVLVDLMQHAKQETVRVSAAKTLLDKAIPDLKAVELESTPAENRVMLVNFYGENDPLKKAWDRLQKDKSGSVTPT